MKVLPSDICTLRARWHFPLAASLGVSRRRICYLLWLASPPLTHWNVRGPTVSRNLDHVLCLGPFRGPVFISSNLDVYNGDHLICSPNHPGLIVKRKTRYHDMTPPDLLKRRRLSGFWRGFLWMCLWTFGFHKFPGIYWLSEKLLASQEGLCSTDL